MGTGLNNRIPPHSPPAPIPRRQIIGLPAGHLKDASGAATAAGLRPLLDLPGRSPRTWQPSGNRRRQSRTPRTAPEPRKTALDTAPLLQGGHKPKPGPTSPPTTRRWSRPTLSTSTRTGRARSPASFRRSRRSSVRGWRRSCWIRSSPPWMSPASASLPSRVRRPSAMRPAPARLSPRSSRAGVNRCCR
jgi:hypothetical protein